MLKKMSSFNDEISFLASMTLNGPSFTKKIDFHKIKYKNLGMRIFSSLC